MKSHPVKYVLFFLPFVAALFLELFILPIHQFTFRVWESLAAKRSFGVLKGQFYPNLEVYKTEQGDLAYYTQCAIPKDVHWITDRYGYRKANTSVSKHPVVIVGDSNIAGSALSQDELLSEVLEKKLGQSVYPLAGERLRALFQHDLLRKHLPEIVILSSIERDMPDGLSALKPRDFKTPSPFDGLIDAVRFNPVVQRVAIVVDRTFKGNMLNYIRARINGSSPSLRRVGAIKQCPIFFLQGSAANRDTSAQRIEATAQRLKEYNDFLGKRGIRFIFLPIPNKETVHYEYLNTDKPDFLERLTRRLEELNIETINTHKAFDDFYQRTRTMLYHRDDSHWNGLAVRLTADLLEQQVRTKPQAISR